MSTETSPHQTQTSSAPIQAANTATTTTTHVHANMVSSSQTIQGSANQNTSCQGGIMGENYFQDYSFGNGLSNGQQQQPQQLQQQQQTIQLAASQEVARRSPPALRMAFNAVMQANQAATNQAAQNLLLNGQTESPSSSASTHQENSNMAHFISGMLQERQNQMVRDRTRGMENQNNMVNAQRTIVEQERAIQEQTKNVQTQQQYSIQQILFYLQQSQVHTLNFLHANMKPKSNQGKYSSHRILTMRKF